MARLEEQIAATEKRIAAEREKLSALKEQRRKREREQARERERLAREQKQRDAVELWDLLEANTLTHNGVSVNALEFVRNEMPKRFDASAPAPKSEERDA